MQWAQGAVEASTVVKGELVGRAVQQRACHGTFLQYHSNAWVQALEAVEWLWVKVLLDKLHGREKGKDAGEVDKDVTVKRSH